MDLTLRQFEPGDADYEAVVAIHNATYPEYTEQAEDWRHWDRMRPAHCKAERWLAEDAGQVVAFVQYAQFPWSYHPQKFYVGLNVLPAYRRRGIGGRLYAHLLERLAPHDPLTIRAELREDKAASVSFAGQRGFVEEMRAFESRLDLAGFDPGPWAGHEAQVLAKGVSIHTLRELLDREGEVFKGELYEAMTAMAHDVPRLDTYHPMPFEEWQQAHFTDQNLMPEGYFVARCQGGVAGVSQLWRHSGDPTVLNTGLTATRRDFRRMGIALALKLRAIAFAQGQGYREVRTGNESNNRPMLSINEALGFVKQPAWITMGKTFA